MALKVVRFTSLLLTALLAGMLFCHLLELPNNMKLPEGLWLAVQQHLYNDFGPVASIIEPAAIATTLLLAFMLRRHRPAFGLTVFAALCLIAHLVEWFLVVNPVNIRVNSWTIATIPADWAGARNRWEYGHAVGAALAIAALAALIAASLADTGDVK